ncbi:MAG: hypothetical protein DWQ08_10355 [Proteobacteria bacterium]|nr:MAG: hypothetical protein DWQ08_10355 [Pseudomonadota bacterium]
MKRRTNRKASQKHDPLATFIALKMEIDEQLARLTQASDDHFHKDPDRINWPDVGDIEHYNAQLKELTDQIFKEGEYAE